MKRAIAVIVGLVSLCACSSEKYMFNPDGTRPQLFPAATVLTWPIVDGAYQTPSGNVRIYIHETARFGDDVRLGGGVRIGARSFVDNDAVLFPNVTVGDDARIGRDAIVQSDVKIRDKVVIGGDAKIGSGSAIESGATVGKWAKLGKGVTVGPGATVNAGSAVGDGVTISKS